jgi:hypothetical protein
MALVHGSYVVRNAVMTRLHYPLDVILLCVHWYVGYSLRRHAVALVRGTGSRYQRLNAPW